MSYPAFTDMYGLVDRGDIVLSAVQTSLALQLSHPIVGPYVQSSSYRTNPWKRTIQTLIFIHCWFHGAVEDRRKVVKWLVSAHADVSWFKSKDLRTFVLCTLAYGMAAAHRELGNVSQVKMDLIVATVMMVAIQFDDEHLEEFVDLPRTLEQVEQYLIKELNADYASLKKSVYPFNSEILSMKSTMTLRTVLDLSNSITLRSLARIANDNPQTNGSLYVTTMQLLQPVLVNFHEQLCPSLLSFDGFLVQLYRTNPEFKKIADQTKMDIFGTQEPRQDSILDSFLPENMTREEAGLQPRPLRQLIDDQIRCAVLRGELKTLEKSLPRHLAIIMDGNRRYARDRNFKNVVMGYTLGARQMMQVFPWCFSAGINSVTLWAMSTDNFNRPPEEVSGLIMQMTLFFEDFLLLDASMPMMGVRVRVTGNKSILPDRLRTAIERVEKLTSNNKNFNLQIAINYGGREEIVMAVKEAMKELGPDAIDKLTPAHISAKIYSGQFGLPPVDGILRTSGEVRLSGFHLWESNSAEFVFVEPHWPELTEVQLLRALVDLGKRQRRHGK
ncbi:Decaprenyl diphosphate synthase-like protein [Gorgonomyces haynaldii]|nr:Decaprenyl diphosphate synthase-like protein [Gorgonomyces haynaldii]